MDEKTFTYPIRVNETHIDSLNHVNNEVYIKWLLEAASAHSSSMGYTIEKFLSDGACFVVRRHTVDYLAPAFLNDDLILETWIKDFKPMRTTRVYEIRRALDGKVILKAETLWVYIDLATGKPMEIPETMIKDYSAFLRKPSEDFLG